MKTLLMTILALTITSSSAYAYCLRDFETGKIAYCTGD
jgi:uncharacterized membrane protein